MLRAPDSRLLSSDGMDTRGQDQTKGSTTEEEDRIKVELLSYPEA